MIHGFEGCLQQVKDGVRKGPRCALREAVMQAVICT